MRLFSNSKINIAFFSLMLFSFTLVSCQKSAEAAAEEVCECMDEKMQALPSGEEAGDTNECNDMAKEFEKGFESEDREIFIKKVGDCAMGQLGL